MFVETRYVVSLFTGLLIILARKDEPVGCGGSPRYSNWRAEAQSVVLYFRILV